MKTVKPNTPIQYIMEKTEFCGLDFLVDERVLIPRPETEMLVETVFEMLHNTQRTISNTKILDLGTGSGCIAIALMVRLCSPSILSKTSRGGRVEGLTKKISDCTMIASDLSEGALDVARQNARIHGVAGRIDFAKSDLFESVKGAFDIIVSNPPYVARTDFPNLQKEVLKEPFMAFDGGQDGLDMYRRIVNKAAEYMNNGAFIVMEMGFGQRKGIIEMFKKAGGFKVVSEKKDYNDIDRVIVAQWISS